MTALIPGKAGTGMARRLTNVQVTSSPAASSICAVAVLIATGDPSVHMMLSSRQPAGTDSVAS